MLHGGISSNAQRQAGLPQAGSGSQNDQIGVLKPTEELIQGWEAGMYLERVLPCGVDGAANFKILFQELANMDEITAGLPMTHLE